MLGKNYKFSSFYDLAVWGREPGGHTLKKYGNRSKAPGKKPPRIIEEIIAKYAIDANLF